MMKNRMSGLFGGAIALLIGVMVGCADSSVQPESAPVDAYASYQLDLATLAPSEFPTLDELVNATGDGAYYGTLADPDSSRKDTSNPKGPKDTSVGKGPKDTSNGKGPKDTSIGKGPSDSSRKHTPPKRGAGVGHLVPKSYRRTVAQLKLSAAQDSAIQVCMAESRRCALDAQKSYLASRRSLDSATRPALDSLRRALDSGSITRAEADSLIRAAKSAYSAQLNALNATFVQALATCRETLDACIRSHLTPEQIEIWERQTR